MPLDFVMGAKGKGQAKLAMEKFQITEDWIGTGSPTKVPPDVSSSYIEIEGAAYSSVSVGITASVFASAELCALGTCEQKPSTLLTPRHYLFTSTH